MNPGQTKSLIEKHIIEVFQEVFKNKGMEPPPLSSQTALDGSLGLESIDFAEVVVRLEEVFGKDPFAKGVLPHIRVLGDLAELYE